MKRAIGVLLLAAIPMSGLSAVSQTKLVREEDLKAVFLLNFTRFVEWPTNSFPDRTTPFVIGVMGDDPLETSLDEVVSGETVRDRRIAVKHCRSLPELEPCQIVFIGRSATPRLEVILKSLEGKRVLTVGDTDAFTKYGGMISFVVVENKLRVRINPAAANAAGVTISSKLLRQAEIVEAKQEP